MFIVGDTTPLVNHEGINPTDIVAFMTPEEGHKDGETTLYSAVIHLVENRHSFTFLS